MFESVSLGLVAVYFIPGIVALLRSHHNTVAIIALNLLLGWTLIGWVAAMVWSLTAVQGKQPARPIMGNAATDGADEGESRSNGGKLVLGILVVLVIVAAMGGWSAIFP